MKARPAVAIFLPQGLMASLPCRVLLWLHLSELGHPLHLAGYIYPMSDFPIETFCPLARLIEMG